MVESTDRALKVDALVTQIDGTRGVLARVQGQWGDELGRAQPAAGTLVVQRMMVWSSSRLPFRPVTQRGPVT